MGLVYNPEAEEVFHLKGEHWSKANPESSITSRVNFIKHFQLGNRLRQGSYFDVTLPVSIIKSAFYQDENSSKMFYVPLENLEREKMHNTLFPSTTSSQICRGLKAFMRACPKRAKTSWQCRKTKWRLARLLIIFNRHHYQLHQFRNSRKTT